jgi:methylated-DNA-[protein]-cysteine S-methyltransferase
MNHMLTIRTAQFKTPFGFAILKVEETQFSVKLSTTAASEHDNIIAIESDPLFTYAADKLDRYFKSPHTPLSINDTFPIETLSGTPYQKRVWQAIANIPAGEVRSYGELADTINSCPRATANACGANHLSILIPCHRVVAKHGIGGFMRGSESGLMIKKWLLAHEGIHYE